MDDPWSLPSRPRLIADVLMSPGPPDCLIVAASARQLLTFPSGGAQLAPWLRGLDGLKTGSEAAQECPLGSSAGVGILRQLDHVGLLAPAGGSAHFRARTGITTASALALAQARQRRHVQVVGDAEFCAPIVGWLTEVGIPTRWRKTPRSDGDLLLWVGSTGHPDARALEVLDLAFMNAVPWLTVEVAAHDAVIAALALPGVSSCSRCRWLTQLDRNPNLALLSASWPDRSLELPQHLAALLQGLVVERTLLALDALLVDEPTTAGAWAQDVVVDFRTAAVRYQDVVPHPQCGCLATAA